MYFKKIRQNMAAPALVRRRFEGCRAGLLIPVMAMACLLTVPAAAADEGTQAAYGANTNALGYTAEVPMFGPGQPVQTYTTGGYTTQVPGLSSGRQVAIGEVEDMVRSSNLQIRALRQTIRAMEEQDPSETVSALRASYQGLNSSIAQMQQTSAALDPTDPSMAIIQGLMQSNIMILTSQAESLKSQINTIEDNYDTQLESLEQTLADTEDQLAFAAESTFLAIKSMEGSYADLVRQRTTLGTTVTEMEKRYELGQISALQLQETRNGLTQLDSGIATLAMNIENTKGDLNLLLGRTADSGFSLAALPVITSAQVSAVNYSRDIGTVLRQSREVRDADEACDDAEDQDNEYAEKAAKLRYDSTVNTVSQNFQKLCRAVTDKQQLVTAAQSDYELAQRNFQVQETKYQNGQISQNAYESAKATLETSANAVTTARNNLYTAYMKYRWALRGIVSTN